MASINCNNCGENITSISGICPKCGKTDSTKTNASRNIAFTGTILLLGTIGLVSYPYVFNNSSTQKINKDKDSLQKDTYRNSIDSIMKDSVIQNNKIPSF